MNRFQAARRGDHLMTAFECDECIFRKLKEGQPPDPRSHQDSLLLDYIRRMNLDAFWSRAARTVTDNARLVQEGIDMSKSVGLEPPYVAMGPFPSHDHCGYGVAIQMLIKSTRAGRYSDTHLQWDSVRKTRTAYGNQVRAGVEANQSTLAVADGDGKSYQRIASDPCSSLWFQRFSMGCKRRMGQDWRPDRAVTPALVAALLEWFTKMATMESSQPARTRWVMGGTYIMSCYVVSLRGPEGLFMDLGSLREHVDDAPEEYTIIALTGRVKGEQHERSHLLPSVNVTGSGLQVRRWIKRLIRAHEVEGRLAGPAFPGKKPNTVMTLREMNEMFWQGLTEVWEDQPNLFAKDIKSPQDIEEKYDVFRSLRRGSDTQALDNKVNPSDIDLVNRWKKVEAAGHSRPSSNLQQYYADFSLLKKPFLRYTAAM